MNNIDTQIKETEEKLADLKEKKLTFEQLPRNKQLAIHLHGLLCHGEHTERCSWGYEEDGVMKGSMWSGTAHRRYLDKADTVIAEYGHLSNDIITGLFYLIKNA